MKKVLLVDDDERFLLSLQSMLKSKGHEIVCATNAKDAYKAIAEYSFHLVLANISVPYASGYELLVAINQAVKQQKSKTPVLVVSDITNNNVIADCLDIGIDEYLTKPIYIPDFMKRVNHFLDISY